MAEETTTLEDLKEAMEGTAPDVPAPGAGGLMSVNALWVMFLCLIVGMGEGGYEGRNFSKTL